MGESFAIKETPFRPYDEAVVNWLKAYNFINAVYGEHASDKYISTISVRYKPTTREFSDPTPVQMQSSIKDIFPRITVSRIGLEQDLNRSLGKGSIRGWNFTESTKLYSNMLVPKPFNFFYQIDIESRHTAHTLNILSTILYDLSPSLALVISHGGNVGEKYGHMTLQGTTDNSSLELSEDQNNSVRWTVDLSMEGWLYQDVITTVTPVELMEITIQDYDTTQIYTEFNIE